MSKTQAPVQSACGTVPARGILADAIQSGTRSGCFSAVAGRLSTSSGKTNSPSKNSKMCEERLSKMLGNWFH